jgi:polyphenol oxidase
MKLTKSPVLKYDEWADFKEIIHFVSTRHGGVSQGPYASLNVGLGTDDDSGIVLKNRHILAKAAGIPLESFVILNQVHGTNVVVATGELKGSGSLDRESAIHETDAIITDQPGICLFVMGADCVPLLFFDPVKKVIGAAHAGWRGTVKNIALATVQKMKETFNCEGPDIRAAIGPSIGPCCYHVGGEVIDSILRSYGSTDKYISYEYKDSLAHFDLWQTNKTQLIEAGLSQHNIIVANLCTHCNHNDFFSSRYDKSITGRFGAGIMIR